MPVKIPEVPVYKTLSAANIKQAFKPRHIVSAMASDGFLPVIALEAFVEAGRTYQAYKRGGFDEARERITEEFSGAVFWLGGVTGLNWLFEKLGQKLLKLPRKTVDIASDNVRKPLNNFLNLEKLLNGDQITQSMMAKFKFVKVISSVLIANAFIGFILPKINQAITRSYHKNDKKNNAPDNFFKTPQISDFGKNNDKNNISFNGAWNLLTIANNFESKRNWKLLSVDAGTASGRAYSARNNDERVEILFRDLSSIYFYMFNMQNMNAWLNKAEHGYKTRLDAVSAEFATKYMKNYLDDKGSDRVSVEEFKREFMGASNDLPQNLKSKFKDGIIKLDEFKAELKNTVSAQQLEQLEQVAEKMSQLQQPIVENGVKQSILTESQARDVLNGGHINNPEFLKAFYRNHFGDKKFLGEYRFIPQQEIDTLKLDLKNYVESVIARAKKTETKEITHELLDMASRNNFKMNALNWGAGFAISAAFLSTFIPKLQYLITKLRTGQNEFPGTEQFRE